MAILFPGGGGLRPLDAEDFARIESLFASVVTLDSHDRQRFVQEACSDRPDLQCEIEALLAAHDRLARSGGSADDDEPAGTGVGSVVGAYRLIAKIGEGGMGEVFRAERADGLYTQQVAVKITRSTIGHSNHRRRFNIERQILASLNHDNIVRLLDGGTTATGQAFLIMEHVDGVPLTTYSREQALSLEARLTLFRMVCLGVQYAHQHAVVHRDLKPGNVLVGTDGIPKIVDFGVAKLLEAEAASGFTSTGLPGPLTPNYASPEQLRGLPVTTASDVYSLGVILYELLAGRRPYETQGQTLERVLAIVVHEQPRRPSSADRGPETTPLPYAPERLRGDLDAIVLKAISKEPGDRYASASELASDLMRFLGGDPVLARAPSSGYVLRRLAVRHKRMVGVAAVALTGILAASGIALWQWQVARRSQARAEQRFSEVRQLANALIFKIHDAVTPLAGSTPVRRTIVDEALGYLERLEAESGDDPTLRLELSAAYRQIGGILGDPSRPNLGDHEGAIMQFERARALVAPFATDQAPYDFVAALINANTVLSSLYNGKGEAQRAVALARETLEYITRYQQAHPPDVRVQKLVGQALFRLALAFPASEAVPAWQRTLDYYEGMLAAAPESAEIQRNVALVGKYLGSILESRADPNGARRQYARSLELDEKRLVVAPDDRTVQFDAAISYSNMASVSEILGDIETAGPLFARSLALRRQLAETDPTNVQARWRLGYLLARMTYFKRERDTTAAIALGREAVQVMQSVFETTRDRSARLDLAFAWLQIGLVQKQVRARDAACTALRRAHELFSDPGAKGDLGDRADEASEAAREAAACRAGTE